MSQADEGPAAAPPPFKLSRETKIRIDRDGRFWNEESLITHESLARSLAGWIDVDPESGRYILRNAVNWAFVTVEDAPLVVRSFTRSPAPAIVLSDGATEPLDVASLRIDGDDVPYCDARGGKLPARFSRQAAYALLEHAQVEKDGRVIVDGREIQRVARGEGARRR
jgi:uncharacterized protein